MSTSNLGSADKLSAKFFFSNSHQNLPFSGATVPGFPALRDFENRNLAIAQTHVFSPSAVNQFRAGFSRIASRSAAPSPLTAQSVGITRVNDPQERSLPHIQILGAFQLGNAPNDKNETVNNNFYVSDTVSLSRGRHSLRFGAEIFRNQFVNGPDNTDGSLLFLSFPDFLLGLPAGPPVQAAMAHHSPTSTWRQPVRSSRTATCARPQLISSRSMTGRSRPLSP